MHAAMIPPRVVMAEDALCYVLLLSELFMEEIVC
mgnify:CR=1 FL=1